MEGGRESLFSSKAEDGPGQGHPRVSLPEGNNLGQPLRNPPAWAPFISVGAEQGSGWLLSRFCPFPHGQSPGWRWCRGLGWPPTARVAVGRAEWAVPKDSGFPQGGMPRKVPPGPQKAAGSVSLIFQPMKPLKAAATTSQPVLTSQQIETIFFKVPELYEIHKDFYDGLFPRVHQWSHQQRVGDLFQKLVSRTLGPGGGTGGAFARLRASLRLQFSFTSMLLGMRSVRRGGQC